jgi:hypothetical protein
LKLKLHFEQSSMSEPEEDESMSETEMETDENDYQFDSEMEDDDELLSSPVGAALLESDCAKTKELFGDTPAIHRLSLSGNSTIELALTDKKWTVFLLVGNADGYPFDHSLTIAIEDRERMPPLLVSALDTVNEPKLLVQEVNVDSTQLVAEIVRKVTAFSGLRVQTIFRDPETCYFESWPVEELVKAGSCSELYLSWGIPLDGYICSAYLSNEEGYMRYSDIDPFYSCDIIMKIKALPKFAMSWTG